MPSLSVSPTQAIHPAWHSKSTAMLERKETERFKSYDYNKSLGQGKKSFFNNQSAQLSMVLRPYEDSWEQYIAKNLTDCEANDIDEDPIHVWSSKSLRKKQDIIFLSNSNRDPLLPSNCLTMKLEDKKHVMRCFLKANYGRNMFYITWTCLTTSNCRDCKRSDLSRAGVYTTPNPLAVSARVQYANLITSGVRVTGTSLRWQRVE